MQLIGNLAYARDHKNRIPLALLTNLLGGSALNSRLNLSIREKYGYAYTVEAAYQPYSDTGLFAVYLGADKKYIKKSLSLINKELNLLKTKKLGYDTAAQGKKTDHRSTGNWLSNLN